MRSLPLIMLAVLQVAGCTSVEDAWLVQNDAKAGAAPAMTGNRELPVQHASASLMGLSESPVSVRSLSGNGTSIQQVVYRNRGIAAGENVLTIEQGPASERRLVRAPSSTALAREIKAAMPGIASTAVPVFRANAYGPYGVASGALPGGGACIYAWQMIQPWPGLGTKQAGTVRLRYCDPQADANTLEGLLSTLSITGGSGALAAYVAPISASPQGAVFGYSPPPTAAPLASPPPRAKTQAATARSHATADAGIDETAPQTGVVVPMPQT